MSHASLSIVSKFTLKTLGEMIKCARLERRMSQSDLAERLNRSRYTVMAIEKGDPEVAIGVVFEAAYIVGVRLIEDDKMSMQKLSNTIANLTAILPKKAKKTTGKYNDNF
jgi:transcriptional regulator with XRE-family HTH domain